MKRSKKVRRRVSVGVAFMLATYTLVIGLALLIRGSISPFFDSQWLIVMIAIVALATSRVYVPRRVQRRSALARLVLDWRYRRAVRAMELRDDYGRPVVA